MFHLKQVSFFPLLAILTCLTLTERSHSQSPVYKNYTVNDGLPSQVVYCALQDKEGYMWFGTDAGVSRFDGRHFENFTIRDGLSDNEILNMFEDSKGRIWFYTLNGKLSYFFNQKFYNEANDSMLSKISAKYEFMSFMEDSNGNLWLGGFGRQLVLIQKDGQVRNFDFNSLKEGYRRLWIQPYEISPEEIYFFTPQEVFQFKDGKMSIKDTSNFLNPLKGQFHLYEFNSSTLYYTCNDEIYKFEKDSSRMLIGQEMLRNYTEAKGIFIDRNEDIWIFTKQDEMVCFTKRYGYYQEGKTYLSGVEIGEIFLDNENNKWLCSIGSGIFMEMSANSDRNKPIIEFLNGTKNTRCLAIDQFDRVWFAGLDGRLNYFENNSLHTFRIPDSVKMRSISFDDKNNLWCVINGGIRYVEKGNVKGQHVILKPINLEYLPGKQEDYYGAKQLAIDRSGQIFVSINSGMAKLFQKFNEKYLVYSNSDNVFTKRIYCMYFDYENNLWFENFEKLYCLRSDSVLMSFPEYNEQFLSQINDIKGTCDSALVIATYGNGIHFFKGGKIINHLSMSEGLAGDLCRKVFVDSSVIYVATNQGFSYFTYRNNEITDLKTITVSDGIVSNDIKDICALGDKIYLATSAGLCIVNKNISQSSAMSPPVYITSVSTRDSVLESFDHLRFPYYTDLNLNYIAITFEQPDKITYQYNLTGNEKDWIATKNTSIAFSALSPGDYTFQLRAKKHNSDWSKPTAIHFSIIPPFWQQWWFRLLFFSALAGSTYYLLQYAAERRYRLQLRLLKEKQSLADERSRISSDMHDDLGADLSNLLLMTRISGQTPSLAEAERSQLHKLEVFASGLVGKVDEIIWALNPRNDTLGGMLQFIHDYTLNIAQLSSLKASVSLPDQIPPQAVSAVLRRNIFLVVKEALNNIVRHSRATELTVAIVLSGNNLEVVIEDNGKGFDINNLQSDGDGLINMRKRIEELKGRFDIKSSVGTASRISMVVPLF